MTGAAGAARESAAGRGERRADGGRRAPLWLVVVLAACAGTGAPPPTPDDDPTAVTVVRPERRALARTLKVPATVEPIQVATLHAKTAGYLSRILVDRGDTVTRGQFLAEISVPEMAREHDAAAARLREADAERDLRRVTAERLAAVQQDEPGAVTRQQVDEARGAVLASEATVERLRAELARLEALMEYATIRAPFAGVVTERFVDPGAMIQVATTSAQAPILTLMDMSTVRVFVDVPEPDVAFVTRSTPARLEVQVLGAQSFEGTVTRYSTALDPGTRTMRAEIDVPNPGRRLRPGMYGVVTLELQRREEALTIPAATLLAGDGRSYVYTVVSGAARRVPVVIGLDDGVTVEILDGLVETDLVILSGRGLVADGAPVRVGAPG